MRAPDPPLTCYQLVVMPHWRPEVDDVVRTLREASASGPAAAVRVVTATRALTMSPSHRAEVRAVLFSDDGRSTLVNRITPAGASGHVFRLWWNGADQIREFLNSEAGADAGGETQICFFPEVLVDLKGSGVDLLQVPYAFSRPRSRPSSELRPSVCFTAEVDISDACFATLVPKGRGDALSAAAWELAEKIVGGRQTLVDADRTLASQWDPEAARAALWAVRNRVRYLLVKALSDAFGRRLVLRGTDWAKVGLDSHRTSRGTRLSRLRRMSDYRRHRVCLDLGSKSTHAMLYPRSADIMAAGGGIVQFDSGATPPDGLPALEGRRVRSADELLHLVERLLTRGKDELAHESTRIQAEYCHMRMSVGTSLSEEIGARCR